MDVSKTNFVTLLPTILSNINDASFIAVDTEFTALLTNENFRRSYFDSGNHLYAKERQNLKDVSIIQIGISVFKLLSDSNTYLVNTYNFYTRPHSLLCIDDKTLLQASVIEFLQLFNPVEWFVNGIPCLNAENEEKVRTFYAQILSGDLKVDVPWKVQDKLSQLKVWTKNSQVGDSRDVHLRSNTEVLFFLSTLLSSGLNLCPSFENDKVCVTVTAFVEEETVRTVAEETLDVILDEMKGFVKVFEALSNADVPLIVHNGYLDLMLIYKQFHRSFPKGYKEFKANVHKMFPTIYDTKQLAFAVKRQLKTTRQGNKDKVSGSLNARFLSNTNLASLKADLEKQMVVLHRPRLQHSSATPKYSNGTESLHEAGYDAFVAGYCFLHLSHVYASLSHFEKIDYQRPLSQRELIHAMKQWKNQIAVGGCSFEYMVLDDIDPKSSFHRWWVVESQNVFAPLLPEALVVSMSNCRGGQVHKLNRLSAVVAPNRSSRFSVMKTFSDHKHVKITRFTKHASKVSLYLWSWALLSSGLSTWLLVRTWKNEN